MPARYATGFSVQEFSRLEKLYIVRARHAHAWALAYIDGSWRDVDTTPPGWSELETRDSLWTSVSDTWSWLALKVAIWRELDRGELQSGPVMVVMLGAAALIAAWFLRRKSLRRIGKKPAVGIRPDMRPGKDLRILPDRKNPDRSRPCPPAMGAGFVLALKDQGDSHSGQTHPGYPLSFAV